MKKGYVEPDDPRYQQWIDDNVEEDPMTVKGLCRRLSHGMSDEFPELRVVGISCFGICEHAWCVNEQGQVVDPTAHQFPEGRTTYDKKPMELTDFPTGKCMNCGELIYPDTPHNREIFGDEMDLGPHKYCDQEIAKEFGSYSK